MNKYTHTMLAILAMTQLSQEQQPVEIRLNTTKEPSKHHSTPERKHQKAGRGRQAKGYDPTTKTWTKGE